MKKAVLIILSVLVIAGNLFAQTPNSGDDFSITQGANGGITITGYTGSRKDVVIPSTIEGIRVTSIQYDSFKNKNITSVIIPNSVKDIGPRAFAGCTSLASVTIPDGVTGIAFSAFEGCSNLTSIVIPDSVKSNVFSFYGQVFKNCTKLASVTIGKGITRIYEENFYGCTSLTSIILPRNVGVIERNAFANCTRLTSVAIEGGNVDQGIMSDAFLNCTGLTSVTLGNYSIIDEKAFRGCNNITSITIGENNASVNGGSNIGEWNKNPFPNNFSEYYVSQNKAAGKYTWSGRLWRREADPRQAQQQLEAQVEKLIESGRNVLNRDPASAIDYFTQAIQLDPNNARLFNFRGFAYDKVDIDKAIDDYTQAIQLNPNFATAYGNRGCVYYEKGDYDKALTDFEAAVRLDPNNADHKYNLEVTQKKLGR